MFVWWCRQARHWGLTKMSHPSRKVSIREAPNGKRRTGTVPVETPNASALARTRPPARFWNHEVVAETSVHLRPFREADLVMLNREATDPTFSLPFEWSGYRSPEVIRRRWEEDGFLDKDPHQLVIADADDSGLGLVMWRDPNLFARDGLMWEIGIILAPEHRGRGVGTEAQRLHARYLFDTTLVHRICAYTEADNVAEQKSLEKAGFRREGVLRQAGFRGGKWRDLFVYALLRSEVDNSNDA
jgi:RimJ/RimL family protein N-acetyltransferase